MEGLIRCKREMAETWDDIHLLVSSSLSNSSITCISFQLAMARCKMVFSKLLQMSAAIYCNYIMLSWIFLQKKWTTFRKYVLMVILLLFSCNYGSSHFIRLLKLNLATSLGSILFTLFIIASDI